MTQRKDNSTRGDRGTGIRAISSRTSSQPLTGSRLTPERTAEIRLKILERAYDSPQIADMIARRLLKRGEL